MVSTSRPSKFSPMEYSFPTKKWSILSPLDWTMIWRSILLLSYDKYFCQFFGKEKILLESLAQRSNATWIHLSSLDTCSECHGPTTAVTGGKSCHNCKIVFMKEFPVVNNSRLCLSCARSCISSNRCGSCSFSYRQLVDNALKGWEKPFYYNSKPVPANPDAAYKSVVHVDVPESLSNPEHFGHLAWKFCEFMASVEGTD
jgi:hypothetical protein